MKIKLCGLWRKEDAVYVNAASPDYCGYVFWKKSRRYVSFETAAQLREMTDNDIRSVGVFVDERAETVAELFKGGIISVAQLHGAESEDYISRLREMVPGIEIWRAFIVKNEADIYNAEKSSADRVLLDCGMGGGKAFEWSLLKPLRRSFILAGGLTPDNISDAAEMKPWCVDLSSGIETRGVKDKEKMAAAVRAAHEI